MDTNLAGKTASGNADGAAETVRAIVDAGGTANPFRIDLTDLNSVSACHEADARGTFPLTPSAT